VRCQASQSQWRRRAVDAAFGWRRTDFTQALIQAIAKVSGRDFPFVVDTPLARLDVDHRIGVLRHFTDRAGQVILLSTDTEVVGPYLDAIRKRVLAAYRLNVHTEDGVTVTTVQEGYFERI
jgi:DNA sulfur modification protein DndD